jgi:hypothetical protein
MREDARTAPQSPREDGPSVSQAHVATRPDLSDVHGCRPLSSPREISDGTTLGSSGFVTCRSRQLPASIFASEAADRDRLASCSARSAGAFVTLIAEATADRPFRLARLVDSPRAADIVHFVEASSSGALGLGDGFRTAHQITFGRWSGPLCAGAFGTLLRHVFLRWVERSPMLWSVCRYHHADSTTSSSK